ncbi:hypothetical protein IP88_15045 [alpha proteobacterium AAP81b]|nr:hypothetical protein IP88_15045 [alpha proteobacterium AAP81b]
MILRLLLAIVLLLPAPALAWGDYAHRLTARIATSQLAPAARAEVRRILARGRAVNTPTCRLASLEDASVWPDCIRGDPDRFTFSFAWHYQNISVCRPFEIGANCPDGNCVTAQIPRQLRILADRRASARARARAQALALAFVVHFVGDMHQPLHIGDKGDRGGNDAHAAYGAKDPPRMNLHRAWDSDLAERALTDPPAVAPQTIAPAQRRAWAAGDVPAWARESWDLSRTVVYPRAQGISDGCAGPTTGRAPLDAAYLAAAREPIRTRVAQAGTRLAMLLNRALAR